MYEIVTVDKALRKGRWTITYPKIAIFIGSIILTIYLFDRLELSKSYVLLGILLSFVLSRLYWSLTITKWRLWAFDNVRNVHELEKRAIKEQLIHSGGSWFEKTEIKSAADSTKWELLCKKFDASDIFTDDFSVPNETMIYYSKSKSIFEMLVFFGGFCGCIYLLIATKEEVLGVCLGLLALGLMYQDYRIFENRNPQIILNAKGIQTAKTDFYEWKEIFDEDVITENSGKYIRHYFVYKNPTGFEKMDVQYLSKDRHAIERLLRIYRGRNENRIKQA